MGASMGKKKPAVVASEEPNFAGLERKTFLGLTDEQAQTAENTIPGYITGFLFFSEPYLRNEDFLNSLGKFACEKWVEEKKTVMFPPPQKGISFTKHLQEIAYGVLHRSLYEFLQDSEILIQYREVYDSFRRWEKGEMLVLTDEIQKELLKIKKIFFDPMLLVRIDLSKEHSKEKILVEKYRELLKGSRKGIAVSFFYEFAHAYAEYQGLDEKERRALIETTFEIAGIEYKPSTESKILHNPNGSITARLLNRFVTQNKRKYNARKTLIVKNPPRN